MQVFFSYFFLVFGVRTLACARGAVCVCVTFENPNAGLLDALAALGTGGGLAYSLGIYPSMMQDEVTNSV